MKKNSFIIAIMTLVMTLIPTFAFAEEVSEVTKRGNIYLYVGCALIAALILSMIIYGRKKGK